MVEYLRHCDNLASAGVLVYAIKLASEGSL